PMRGRVERVGVVAGAIAGGIVVGSFNLQPAWLWGMAGGVAGGFIGALAVYAKSKSWPWPLRTLAVILIVGGGFFALWMIAGRQFVLNPMNYQITSP
ncbi:MAG TPA: hypothetical protein VK689_08220, partial [Armatimonadota bacterium]|nr:hypothetical protein [Armatimonadota bacterium]